MTTYSLRLVLKWEDMNIEQIIGGVTPDGTRYLKLFLIDYKNIFKNESVCASCQTKLSGYLKKYTIKMKSKDNTCQWRLKEKYNGIQLEPCSSVFLTNATLNDELAQRLFDLRGAKPFDRIPDSATAENKTIVEPATDAPKLKRTRRTKKQ